MAGRPAALSPEQGAGILGRGRRQSPIPAVRSAPGRPSHRASIMARAAPPACTELACAARAPINQPLIRHQTAAEKRAEIRSEVEESCEVRSGARERWPGQPRTTGACTTVECGAAPFCSARILSTPPRGTVVLFSSSSSSFQDYRSFRWMGGTDILFLLQLFRFTYRVVRSSTHNGSRVDRGQTTTAVNTPLHEAHILLLRLGRCVLRTGAVNEQGHSCIAAKGK